jgi:hypothetical protein
MPPAQTPDAVITPPPRPTAALPDSRQPAVTISVEPETATHPPAAVPRTRKPSETPALQDERETVTPREPAKTRSRITRREEPPLRAEPEAKGAGEREARPPSRRTRARETPAVTAPRPSIVEPRHSRATAQREKRPQTADRAPVHARPSRIESDNSMIPVIPLPEALRPTRPPAGSPL